MIEIDRMRESLVVEWNKMIFLLDQAKTAGDKEAVKDLTTRERAHWNRVESIDLEKEKVCARIAQIDIEIERPGGWRLW
jgi:hypothetical protein